MFTTLRKEERLRSQPVRLQESQRAFPKSQKAKEREKVVAMELAVLNLQYLEGNPLQVRWINYHADII